MVRKVVSTIDLETKRKEKELEQQLVRGRTPLSVTHSGRVGGSPHLRRPGDNEEELGPTIERLQRIRDSIDSINRLMKELRK